MFTRIYKLTNSMCLLIVVFFTYSSPALALNLSNAFDDSSTGYAGPLDKTAKNAGYDISKYSPDSFIAGIIQTALSFVGVIFLCLMVYGGYLWMTARGNEEQVTKAKNLIIAAIIGMIIIISAYAITFFIVSKIGSQTLLSS